MNINEATGTMTQVECVIVEALKNAGVLEAGFSKLKITTADGNEVEMVSLIKKLFRNNPLLQVVEDVKEFCLMAGQEIQPYPKEMSQEMKQLRMSLIEEETKELRDACEVNDEIEERDGTGDTLYVLAGYALQRGIHSALSSDWNKIHASNMSKFPKNEEEAKDTVTHHKRMGVNCEKKQLEDGRWIVTSLEPENKGKLLKSHLYSPVKLRKII